MPMLTINTMFISMTVAGNLVSQCHFFLVLKHIAAYTNKRKYFVQLFEKTFFTDFTDNKSIL